MSVQFDAKTKCYSSLSHKVLFLYPSTLLVLPFQWIFTSLLHHLAIYLHLLFYIPEKNIIILHLQHISLASLLTGFVLHQVLDLFPIRFLLSLCPSIATIETLYLVL